MLKNISKLRKAAMGLSFLLFFTAVPIAPISGLVNEANSCIWPFRRKQQTQEEVLKKELKKGSRIDIKFIEKVQRTEQHQLYLKIWKARRAEEWKRFKENRDDGTWRAPYPGYDKISPRELEVFVEECTREIELRYIEGYLESKKLSLKKKADKALKRYSENLFDEIYPGMSENVNADVSSTIKTSTYEYDALSMIMKIVGKEYGRLLYKGSPLQTGSRLEQKVLQETAYDMLGNDFSFRFAKELFRSEHTEHDLPNRYHGYINELFKIEDGDKTILETEFGNKIKAYPNKGIRTKLSYLIRNLGPYFFIDTTKYLTNFNEVDYAYKLATETHRLNGIELKQRSIENQEIIKDMLGKGVSGWKLRSELVKESVLLHELYGRLPKVKGILDPILDMFKKNNEREINQ